MRNSGPLSSKVWKQYAIRTRRCDFANFDFYLSAASIVAFPGRYRWAEQNLPEDAALSFQLIGENQSATSSGNSTIFEGTLHSSCAEVREAFLRFLTASFILKSQIGP